MPTIITLTILLNTGIYLTPNVNIDVFYSSADYLKRIEKTPAFVSISNLPASFDNPMKMNLFKVNFIFKYKCKL